MTSRHRRNPGHRPSVLPETRSGAAFLGLIIIGLCAMIGDDIAVYSGRSGHKLLLGFAILALWAAGLSFTVAIWLRAYRISRMPKPGHCHYCNYNLTGNVSGICPECGTPIPPERAHEICQK